MSEPRTHYCSRCLTTFVPDFEHCPNLGCRTVRPANGWGELLEPGDLIDRTYRVLQRLAIGGAGVTYLARETNANHEEVGDKVAIKMLYQQRDQGPYLRRLAMEAQILQGLQHPHIVQYMGFVHRAGHSPYLVTQFEQGGSLLDHIRRVGVLSVPVTAAIGRQVVQALGVAHQQGVVHRDLKPENVLLEGIVGADTVPVLRVADFGIAKVFGGVGERLTRVGAFVGTPQYAAPEQFEGMTPEPATDIYAVGALLYFCLMARPVADFMAELSPDDQYEHLVRHLPPRIKRPDLPAAEIRAMEEVLALAMAVQPGSRCSVAALDEHLARIIRAPNSRANETLSFAASLTLDTPADTPSEEAAAAVAPSAIAPPVAPPIPPPLPPADPPVERTRPGSSSPRIPKIEPDPHRTDPPRVEPDPARAELSRTAPRPEERAGRSGTTLGCGAIAAAGVVMAMVLSVVALWWWANAPVLLTSKEPDPERKKDWELIAGTLGDKGIAAEAACKAPPYQAVEVIVDGHGKLQRLKLPEYPSETTRACMEEQLSQVVFPRNGDYLARVSIKLQR